jgi:hypothetical protein
VHVLMHHASQEATRSPDDRSRQSVEKARAANRAHRQESANGTALARFVGI